jgi:hypothetical protein
MFKWYIKCMFTALVAVFWLWALTNSFAALSSRSDIGVVLGLGGVVSASALAIWLLLKLYGGKNAKDVTASSTGGAGRR